ncbi:PLP-dependent aminotransferase family protein [Paraburkholderia pallida]|uniref:PLP-dependent aminotransferase family protein n=1 Tax=Paraburkholderia pallida TaxID=2547399 RepID=A0A4P7CXL0_9BURK|nr:PLP-dependent aminotransferase family protein [Paraburkholderia pallida]QBR00989.1 PLP-dependent aminotransferase family protein [Paraburkholderia pallida]
MYEFTSPFQQPSGSPIRELFKYLSEPGMISFAGGYPASDLFDVEGLRLAGERAYASAVQCLQYGPTDGLATLKRQIVDLMSRRGASCEADEVVATTGSQQGLDLLLRVLVEPGDVVLTEEPAYPATLQAFRLQRARIVAVPTDAHGIRVDELAALLESGACGKPSLLYTVPTFANPTGATLAAERRRALLALAVKYRFVVIEDDPYGDLRFAGTPLRSLLAEAEQVDGARNWVVHFASLSKIVAPGLRVGWMVGPREIMRRCVIAKQTVDLCSSPWTQAVAAEYLAAGALEQHLPKITAAYGVKCRELCSALREQLGDAIEFQQPEGGMFVWARLPGIDASDLLARAIEQKVIFVPGKAFYADAADRAALRLSFAAPDVEAIREGARRMKRAYEQAKG